MSNFTKLFKLSHGSQSNNKNNINTNTNTNTNTYNSNYNTKSMKSKSLKSLLFGVPLINEVILSNINYNRMMGANEMEYRRCLMMYPRF